MKIQLNSSILSHNRNNVLVAALSPLNITNLKEKSEIQEKRRGISLRYFSSSNGYGDGGKFLKKTSVRLIKDFGM